ncbi:capsule assembly Wzi family protein [Thalassotalea nanhaiensis]|uniref:Capsule assembly Wzi family protein n=1 Tax=Thalassotalea nanhaiensis TaxID=3065648 RepID=A0ABY9TGJ4_9GAMM|nr:capsule assembly Wzi family protein [Colwelliaceae bacterium SQ345]
MFFKSLKAFIFTCTLLSSSVFAGGVSPYLPLKTDPLIELEIERLASLAKMPVLNKPYHAATVLEYLSKIEESHPVLHHRINSYLKRYKKEASITHFSLSGANSFEDNKTLANARGQQIDSHYQVSAAAFWQFNKYIIANVGGTFYEDGDFIPNHSYLSFGVDWLQIDVGFREHWLSPHQDSALLVSTHAQPPLNITFSNVKPFEWFNIRYELSVGLLDDTDNILFEDGYTSGEVGFITMHGSLQPLDFWTIGFNRTLMFGGGDRSISFDDIWNGITDPAGSDNCLDDTDNPDITCGKDDEIGNQMASITNKFDLTIFDMPMSFYHEYAGEDTKQHKNTQLGNIALNYGLFFPYITEQVSLNIEHANFMHGWYVHSIYTDGYTNNGSIMGHWWGGAKPTDEKNGGTAWSVRVDYDIDQQSQLQVMYRTADIETAENNFIPTQHDYERSHELEFTLNNAHKTYFYTSKLHIGKDTLGEEFLRASVAFRY